MPPSSRSSDGGECDECGLVDHGGCGSWDESDHGGHGRADPGIAGATPVPSPQASEDDVTNLRERRSLTKRLLNRPAQEHAHAQLAAEPEPRRLDTDGREYTKTEFLDYYGDFSAWEAAKPMSQGSSPRPADEQVLDVPTASWAFGIAEADGLADFLGVDATLPGGPMMTSSSSGAKAPVRKLEGRPIDTPRAETLRPPSSGWKWPGDYVSDLVLMADGAESGPNAIRAFVGQPRPPSKETPLPPNWQQVFNEEHNRYFYRHCVTSQVTWERPPPPQPLPKGWFECAADNGSTYYANKETQQTQWDRPHPDPDSLRAEAADEPNGGIDQPSADSSRAIQVIRGDCSVHIERSTRRSDKFDHEENRQKVLILIEQVKQHVPISLKAEEKQPKMIDVAKQLLETYIRDDLCEPRYANYYVKEVKNKLFTLAEVNEPSVARGGFSSTNNSLERCNGKQKDSLDHEQAHITQALPKLFKHISSISQDDLEFNMCMPRGYYKVDRDFDPPVITDKEVWTRRFFSKCQEEIALPCTILEV
jgi:hypothetical protein